MTLKITPHSCSPAEVALSKQFARYITSAVTSITDSSAGVSGSAVTITDTTSFVNVAASGSNLASKATADAALVTVQDALLELATKANEYATKMGVPTITYNGGGVAVDGTIAAVTVSTTGATTGPTAANFAASVATVDAALYSVAVLTNKLLYAQGKTAVTITGPSYTAYVSTVPVLDVDTNVAAASGVTKVAADAYLVTVANSIATLATKLNLLNDGLTSALAYVGT